MQAEYDAYPYINTRYMFVKHNCCPNPSDLDFNDSQTWCLQECGRQNAAEMLGVGAEKASPAIKEWIKDDNIRLAFPDFHDYLMSKL